MRDKNDRFSVISCLAWIRYKPLPGFAPLGGKAGATFCQTFLALFNCLSEELHSELHIFFPDKATFQLTHGVLKTAWDSRVCTE